MRWFPRILVVGAVGLALAVVMGWFIGLVVDEVPTQFLAGVVVGVVLNLVMTALDDWLQPGPEH